MYYAILSNMAHSPLRLLHHLHSRPCKSVRKPTKSLQNMGQIIMSGVIAKHFVIKDREKIKTREVSLKWSDFQWKPTQLTLWLVNWVIGYWGISKIREKAEQALGKSPWSNNTFGCPIKSTAHSVKEQLLSWVSASRQLALLLTKTTCGKLCSLLIQNLFHPFFLDNRPLILIHAPRSPVSGNWWQVI